jgi:hypothetical protein
MNEKQPELPRRSPTSAKANSRAKQSMTGTAKVGGQRRGHPKQGDKKPKAIRVNVAARGASDREEKILPLTMHRTQGDRVGG